MIWMVRQVAVVATVIIAGILRRDKERARAISKAIMSGVMQPKCTTICLKI